MFASRFASRLAAAVAGAGRAAGRAAGLRHASMGHQALRFDINRKKLNLVQVDVPRLSDDEVLVEVVYSGVCAMDLQIINGSLPCVMQPTVLGHEICGIVTETGEKVTRIKKGQEVAIDPFKGCGLCKFCARGKYHFCQYAGATLGVGFNKDGGWAEYCAVPANQVFPLPPGTALELGVLAQPISCVLRGVERSHPLSHESGIVVLGGGMSGICFAYLLHHMGHRGIVVSEPNYKRRDIIATSGLDGIVAMKPEDLRARRHHDPDWGVDLVVDCCGQASAIEEAVDYLLPGGRLCLYGCTSPECRVAVSPFLLFQRELSIVASTRNPYAFPKALSLLGDMGHLYFNYDKIGAEIFHLKDFQKAFDALERGRIAKAIFQMQ